MTIVCLDLEHDKLYDPEVQIVKKETTTVKTHSGQLRNQGQCSLGRRRLTPTCPRETPTLTPLTEGYSAPARKDRRETKVFVKYHSLCSLSRAQNEKQTRVLLAISRMY